MFFRKAFKKKKKEINSWVVDKLRSSLQDIDSGNFYKNLKSFK